MGLKRITAPTEQPVSLADLKAFVFVEHDDDDGTLAQVLASAIAAVDGPDGIGYCCCAQTWRLTLDRFSPIIRLPLGPIADDADLTVSYIDTTGASATLDPTDVRLTDGVLAPAFGANFPSVQPVLGAVTIDFVAGTAAAEVPAQIKLAILQIAAERYRNREAGEVKSITSAVLEELEAFRSGWMAS